MKEPLSLTMRHYPPETPEDRRTYPRHGPAHLDRHERELAASRDPAPRLAAFAIVVAGPAADDGPSHGSVTDGQDCFVEADQEPAPKSRPEGNCGPVGRASGLPKMDPTTRQIANSAEHCRDRLAAGTREGTGLGGPPDPSGHSIPTPTPHHSAMYNSRQRPALCASGMARSFQ